MEIIFYGLLVLTLALCFWFFVNSDNPIFAVIVLVLALSGFLMTIVSPAYIVTGTFTIDENLGQSVHEITTTNITEELPTINTILMLLFIMSFLVIIVQWALSNSSKDGWYR